MKNSILASLIAYAEALVWNKKILANSSNLFICPSSFLKNNMQRGGFNPNQLKVLSNFILEEKLTCLPLEKKNFYCYVGRLSNEKGIETLLRAAIDLPQYELRIIGTGPLDSELNSKYSAKHIIFEGYKKWDELKLILRRSRFMVIPSECYENNPLSVIESLCMGTPVLGARIGGIPELISEDINGYTFISRDINHLKERINHMFNNSSKFDYIGIAREAREKFDSRSYYRQISNIYKDLLKTRNS
jgi:glycosyltransferase involved in cell wall biosynthesis